MLEKTIDKRDSFDELIELPLKQEGICVIAIGPPSCLRVLYFRAKRAGLLKQFFAYALDPIDVISAAYEEELIEFIQEIIEAEADLRGIVLYLSCAEILTGMSFAKTQRKIREKYELPVHVLKRGPLVKRLNKPRKMMEEILKQIDEHI